jgi:hypothetical protein
MKNNNLTRKIAINGILLAIGLVITVILHLTGLGIGPYLLPMHFVVILSTLTTGYFGIILAVLIPLLNFLMGLMPAPIALFLIIELVLLASILSTLHLFSGKSKCTFKFKNQVMVFVSIILTKTFLILGVMLVLSLDLVAFGGTAAGYVASSTLVGLGGLSLSFIVTPIIYDRVKISSQNYEEEHRNE